ncbi:MAG: hypothetical protein AAGH79_10515 [Bacteroidota bacterium]
MKQHSIWLLSLLFLCIQCTNQSGAPEPGEAQLPALPLATISQLGEEAVELGTMLDGILDTSSTRSIMQDLNMVTNALGPENNLSAETISSTEKVVVGLKAFEELISRSPTPAESYLIGGEFLHRIDEPSISEAYYLFGFKKISEEIRESDDKQKLVTYFNALLAGTKAFRQQGKLELAEKTVNEAIEINDRPQAYKERAYVRWDGLCRTGFQSNAKDLQNLERDLVETLQYQADPNLQAMLGHVYYQMGKPKLSTVQFDKTDLADQGKRRQQFTAWKEIMEMNNPSWSSATKAAILLLPLGYFAPLPAIAAERAAEAERATTPAAEALAKAQALVMEGVFTLNSGQGQQAEQYLQQAGVIFDQIPDYNLSNDPYLQALDLYGNISLPGLLRSLEVTKENQ